VAAILPLATTACIADAGDGEDVDSVEQAQSAAVSYTWSFIPLGPGTAKGGGVLFNDGTASGNLVLSAINGQIVVRGVARDWFMPDPSLLVFCFDLQTVKCTFEPVCVDGQFPQTEACEFFPIEEDDPPPVEVFDIDGDGVPDFVAHLTSPGH
jgi:hypothetical protein